MERLKPALLRFSLAVVALLLTWLAWVMPPNPRDSYGSDSNDKHSDYEQGWEEYSDNNGDGGGWNDGGDSESWNDDSWDSEGDDGSWNDDSWDSGGDDGSWNDDSWDSGDDDGSWDNGGGDSGSW